MLTTLQPEKWIYSACWAIAYSAWIYFSGAELWVATLFGCSLGLVWFLITSLIRSSLSYFKVKVYLLPLLVTLSLAATAATLLLIYCFQPIINLIPDLYYKIGFGIGYFLLYLNFGLFTYISRLTTQAKEEAQLRQTQLQLAHQAGLQELQHKFQPHFLYNSLNTINALVGIDQRRARKMIINLSDLLRRSVSQTDLPFQSLAEELATLHNYLAIEQERFGDRLNIECSLPPEGQELIQIPPFLLQPVLENAIKFGLNGTLGKVTINVNISFVADQMAKIEIINPTEETANTAKGTGQGLRILKRRLVLAYQRQDLFLTEIKEGYFHTIIYLPTR